MTQQILEAINTKNMIFISAQPDTVYFHWQVELYLYQFSKHGIKDRCYAIFGYTGDKPSDYIVNLAIKYPTIRWYKDERITNVDHYYIPSIRPHILKKFFTEHPDLGKNVFYHDSDIFIVKLPKFDLLLHDDTIGYLSDTVSYIGHDYIMSCCNRYKEKYPSLTVDDLFIKMCAIVDINPSLVKSNENNSGGAQYLLKGIDAAFWSDVENSTVKLYDMLKKYEKQYPVDHDIQSWTSDMWAVLWNYWKRGNKTNVHTELYFSWATDSLHDYFDRNIFHLAGVTSETASDKFYKGKYTNVNIFDEYIKNPLLFNHVSKTSATFGYTTVLKDYVDNNHYIRSPTIVLEIKEKRDSFNLTAGKDYDGSYSKHVSKVYFGKPLWTCGDTYIIFYNATSWILTNAIYETEISETCGGHASNTSEEPYENGWNISCITTF